MINFGSLPTVLLVSVVGITVVAAVLLLLILTVVLLRFFFPAEKAQPITKDSSDNTVDSHPQETPGDRLAEPVIAVVAVEIHRQRIGLGERLFQGSERID